MIVTALNLISLGGMFVVVLKSPTNMRRIAAYLQARAHAQEDIAVAVRSIRNQQREFQRTLEIELGLEEVA